MLREEPTTQLHSAVPVIIPLCILPLSAFCHFSHLFTHRNTVSLKAKNIHNPLVSLTLILTYSLSLFFAFAKEPIDQKRIVLVFNILTPSVSLFH